MRDESVALHRGRTTMVWQASITNEARTLCAMVTQTQLALEGSFTPRHQPQQKVSAQGEFSSRDEDG